MVALLTLAARVVLSAVFAVAGAAKLADRSGSHEAFVAFGAPRRIAGVLAFVIPIAELAIAGLLLPSTTAVAGAIGALALLALFSGAIAVNLARGRTPECHCFGQLHSAPAGWMQLARNAVLAGAAVFVLAASLSGSTTSATAWIGRLDGPELVALAVAVSATVLLAVGAVAFLSLLRSYGKILVRLDSLEAALADAGIQLATSGPMPEIGLEPGSPAPSFSASSLTGERLTLESLKTAGLPTLLLFTSPHCGPCKTLLPIATEWQHEHADALAVIFVTDGSRDEAQVEAGEFGLEHVLLDEDHSLYQAFDANGTPSAVLIAADGTIGSWVASGSDWIERLVLDLAAQEEQQGLPVGAEPPALELPSLDGERVALAELRGRDSLLLFWNPGCGYCRGMHDDLLAWETSANGVEPQLVVVSSGDEESTRAEGFRSVVLLDADSAAGSAFGADGTPMAVLIGADGRIASEVVAGSDAVLSLAGARPST